MLAECMSCMMQPACLLSCLPVAVQGHCHVGVRVTHPHRMTQLAWDAAMLVVWRGVGLKAQASEVWSAGSSYVCSRSLNARLDSVHQCLCIVVGKSGTSCSCSVLACCDINVRQPFPGA
jgi:hypothetical protein